jgi:hypothetical protein
MVSIQSSRDGFIGNTPGFKGEDDTPDEPHDLARDAGMNSVDRTSNGNEIFPR